LTLTSEKNKNSTALSFPKGKKLKKRIFLCFRVLHQEGHTISVSPEGSSTITTNGAAAAWRRF
jgi:hypothetical protein